MPKYIMALDSGTTSNRCILFDRHGNVCSVAQKEFTQIFPQPGWVEHDADESFATQLEVAKQAMANIGAVASDIAAIGIIVSILNQVLSRSGRDEQATMTTLAGLVVVLMMVAREITELFDLVKTLFHF